MPVSDLELLGMQAERRFDDRGRVIGLYGVTIACSQDDHALWIGAEVPGALAGELTAVFDRGARSSAPSDPPPLLEACRRLLETGARTLECAAGPSYLFGPEPPIASTAKLHRSDTSNGEALRHANPGNWLAVEWDELLDGRLGPWTMATEAGVVASICHTPGPFTARAAECGVWTDPAFRGRGHAAAVTSAWADILRPLSSYLFYSTDAENRSSQAVARRLRLRPLGWTWRLGAVRPREGIHVHPLSTLRARPVTASPDRA